MQATTAQGDGVALRPFLDELASVTEAHLGRGAAWGYRQSEALVSLCAGLREAGVTAENLEPVAAALSTALERAAKEGAGIAHDDTARSERAGIKAAEEVRGCRGWASLLVSARVMTPQH